MRYFALRCMFELLWATSIARLAAKRSECRGIILTLHRVLPDAPADFSPNSILQVTPKFLEKAITGIRRRGFEIVDLDEAKRRVLSLDAPGRFVVLTFDDAYRDNLDHALPILQRLECPFTLFVPTGLVDGVGEVWWQALEDIIDGQQSVAVDLGEGNLYLATRTLAEKMAAYTRIYSHMRAMPEIDRVALIGDLAEKYGLDLAAHCRALIMDWRELKSFADEPLCTIGAHTVLHHELAKLTETRMRNEIGQSVNVLASQLGLQARHLSYPIGGPASAGKREFEAAAEFGFKTAVTTRPGGLYAEHANHLCALPRVSLNGRFQAERYLDVLLSGPIFALMNGGKRLNTG